MAADGTPSEALDRCLGGISGCRAHIGNGPGISSSGSPASATSASGPGRRRRGSRSPAFSPQAGSSKSVTAFAERATQLSVCHCSRRRVATPPLPQGYTCGTRAGAARRSHGLPIFGGNDMPAGRSSGMRKLPVASVETNIPGVHSFVPPPRGLDLATASQATLLRHGVFFRRPMPGGAAEVRAVGEVRHRDLDARQFRAACLRADEQAAAWFRTNPTATGSRPPGVIGL